MWNSSMKRAVCAADVMIFFISHCTFLWMMCIPYGATEISKAHETFLVCKSPECIERAKLINETLTTTIDPCNDFYAYVCDRWESNHPLPGGRGSYDVYQEIRKNIPEILSYILGNRTLVESNQTIIDKVTAMYNTCLALPDTPGALRRVLDESGFNPWPILTEQNIFNSSNCTNLLHHMNISAILHVGLSRNPYGRPSSRYEIYIRPMPVQAKIKKMKDHEIRAVIDSTINLLNPGTARSKLKNLTDELVKFAHNLSNTMGARGSTGVRTISQLEKEYGNTIPISALLKNEFKNVNIILNDTQKLNVDYNYYKKLSTFLETADPNTLYNYAAFLRLFPYLDYVQNSNESELTVNTTKSRNWSECIKLLDKITPDILDYLYVTNEPNHTAIKNEVKVIARRLHDALNETLQNNTWLDNATRAAVQKKLEEVTVGIGYPDMLLNLSVLETGYQYVPFFPLNISFIEALYHIEENLYKMKLRKFQYPEEGNLGWNHSPRKGSPSHDIYWTKIDIPSTLLVSPFFELGLPRSLNYGGIGGAIASQLANSISIIGNKDHISREYEKFMTKDSIESFKNRTSCFLRQYKAVDKKLLLELDHRYNENTSAEADEHEAFFARSSKYDRCYMTALLERHNETEETPGKMDNTTEECLKYWREYFQRYDKYWLNLRVYWSLTLNEDVADNTGLHTAFNAYTKVFQEECDGQDTRLTGLEGFSAMQLFFISNARTHCRIASNDTLIREIRLSSYSTARNRVNGAMKNLGGFAKAFNCSVGSPMNPAKNETCAFW